jgi:hypothetical protein
MSFNSEYPDFKSIEAHIRKARLERTVAVSQALVNLGEAFGRGLKKLVASLNAGYQGERDRRAIEADAFLKRSVPRY